MASSGNDEPPRPGQGVRSLHMWRQLAEARRTLDQQQAAGQSVAVEELLRSHGIDESFLRVLETAEDAPVAATDVRTAPPTDDDHDDETPTAGCVVRSGGRISLKVL